MVDEDDPRRHSAVYADTINRLRHTQPDLPTAEMDRIALAAVDVSIYGADAKKDRKGNFIPQGIGSAGHESGNHFAAIRRYQGEEAWKEAVAEIWKRSPDHAKKLGLPQPART